MLKIVELEDLPTKPRHPKAKLDQYVGQLKILYYDRASEVIDWCLYDENNDVLVIEYESQKFNLFDFKNEKVVIEGYTRISSYGAKWVNIQSITLHKEKVATASND